MRNRRRSRPARQHGRGAARGRRRALRGEDDAARDGAAVATGRGRAAGRGHRGEPETQQERPQALTRLQLDPLQVLARPRQAAHRLLLLVRHPHRPQLPRPMQPRQHQRIAPVRLHPLPPTTRDQARRHHLASVPRLDNLPIHPMPTQARLVTEAHHLTVRTQCPNQPQQRLALVLDLAPVHRLPTPRKRHRDRDGVLVNVRSDVCATLVHDLPSSWWLCVEGPDLEHNPRVSRPGQVNS